jgi:hypothetical protein
VRAARTTSSPANSCARRVTSIAPTICQEAATESTRDTELAFRSALYRDVVADRALAKVLAREPRRKGAPVIRSLIRDPRLTAPTANDDSST